MGTDLYPKLAAAAKAALVAAILAVWSVVPSEVMATIQIIPGQSGGGAAASVFSNANGISFGTDGSTVTATVQTNYLTTGMASNRGSDFVQATAAFAGTSASGTIASNGISVSIGPYLTTAMLSNAATISNIRLSAGTTSNLASAFTFANSNGISFGLDNGTITGTVQTNYLTTAALSGDTSKYVQAWEMTGNTAGTTSSAQGTKLYFSGGNNITLSGNSNTIVVSAGAGGGAVVSNAIQQVSSATGSGTNTSRFAADDHVHAGVYHCGVSNDAGNTAGDTRVSFGRFVFRGGNNITLSQITAANELNTVVISGGAGGGFSAGASNLGNTAGSTGVTGTRLVLVGTNNITLSQSTDANGGTVSFSAPNPGGGAGATLSAWPPLWPVKQTVITATVNSGASGGTGGSTQWTYSGRLWPVDIPAEVHWNKLDFGFGIAATSAGTGSATNQLLFGIYSLNANTALSLLTSYVWSQAMSQNSITARSHRWGWGTNSTSNSTSLGGDVSATFTGTRQAFANNTNNNQTLSTGRWYFCHALLQRTSSVNVFAVVSLAEELGTASTSGYSVFGTNNLVGRPGHWGGVFSTTTNTPAITVTAMPGSVHTSAITQTDNASRWRPVFFQLHRSIT